MAANSYNPARFILPLRIRNKEKSSIELEMKLALIERIADLRGIETVERRDHNLFIASVPESGTHIVPTWALPKFLRTSLH